MCTPLEPVPENKIVIVVCPLNSLIQDQVKILQDLGYPCGVLRYEDKSKSSNIEHPFAKSVDDKDDQDSTDNDSDNDGDSDDDGGDIIFVKTGSCKLLFGHSEAFLSGNGRKLLRSCVYQKNVVSCVIDEAHCVMEW